MKLEKTNDGHLLKLVSKIYLQKNNVDSAIFFIEKAHEYICTDDLHAYWADCLTEANRLKDANMHYLLAVNIVPHKFGNRIKLLDNLLQLKDINSAKICALDIIQLPEKIPSEKSRYLRKKAILVLESLNKIKNPG